MLLPAAGHCRGNSTVGTDGCDPPYRPTPCYAVSSTTDIMCVCSYQLHVACGAGRKDGGCLQMRPGMSQPVPA
eukprot:1728264-Rhodomonas_salina.2